MRQYAFAIATILVFAGCAEKCEPIKVPQKCQTEKPERPIKTGDYAAYLASVLEYTEMLEKAFDSCK